MNIMPRKTAQSDRHSRFTAWLLMPQETVAAAPTSVLARSSATRRSGQEIRPHADPFQQAMASGVEDWARHALGSNGFGDY